MRCIAALCAALLLTTGCDRNVPADEPQESAERIVSLAPSLTELLFTIGAGERVVGVSAWSDYPREVLQLPIIGDAFTIDHEQLRLTEPDLIVAWESGTPASVVDELRANGFRVTRVRTRTLEDIALAMLQLGELTGLEESAAAAANEYRAGIDALRREYSERDPVSVFYQVSARPLYTINREHFVSELIGLCGGTNVFSDLTELAPAIDVEAVVDRNPEVMLASTDAGNAAFDVWARWPELTANRLGNQYLLPAGEVGRATTRVVRGGTAMCTALEQARQKRDADG